MKIGYSFNELGKDNFIKEKNNLSKIYSILNIIRQEIFNKNEVFIISRGKRNVVLSNIKKLGLYMVLKKKNIITDLKELKLSISEIIKDNNIDVFFDENVLNIHEINREKKKGNLKVKLYLFNSNLHSYKRIYSSNIRILSYNLNWENMKSIQKCPIRECTKINLCAININKFILNELPLDFIFLQEVANKKTLFNKLNRTFNVVMTTSNKESMVILINKKYNLFKKIEGEFESGRPFLVVFLKENICLINVHMGHKKNILNELKKIEKKINLTNIDIESYRFILGGDFNENIGKDVLFCKKLMRNFKKNLKNNFTCCINSSYIGKNRDILNYNIGKNIDHILDSSNEPVYGIILNPIDNENNLLPSSDHLAIYAELNQN